MQTLILGAGASGMMAALQATKIPGNRVTVLERQSRVGKKLSATGNGRCNLTNLHANSACYHSSSGDSFAALQYFTPADTLAYFESLGLLCISEASGRCYPFSDQAGSVVDVLRFALAASAAKLELGSEVHSVSRSGSHFRVETSTGRYSADRLIIACGGPAGEKLGATQDGAQFLRALGHSVTPLQPGLVQLHSKLPLLRSLKGVRAEAELLLEKDHQPLARCKGEVQFTDSGVSGPAVFDLSREAAAALPCTLHLDLLPPWDAAALAELLKARCKQQPDLTGEDILTGMLHNRLGRVCVRAAGLVPDMPLCNFALADLEQLAETVKDFTLTIDGTYGLASAQVTVGGGVLSQFCPDTLESRLVPGLYACGEVLDVDGACGGYNLQWAWASGHLAGQLLHKEEPV